MNTGTLPPTGVSSPPPSAGTQDAGTAGKLLKLPPFKPVVAKLLHLDPAHSEAVPRTIQLIRSDPAFTSELLHLANSCLFNFSAEIDSIERATLLVGLGRIKALAMRVAAESFISEAIRDPAVKRCWLHSIVSAAIAESLAAAFRISSERAYMTGLLHDIGRLGLLKAFPAEYMPLLNLPHDTKEQGLATERVMFGFDHCQAGALLSRTWGFPAYLGTIAEQHHQSGGRQPDLLGLVQLACGLADSMGFGTIQMNERVTLDGELAPYPTEIRSALAGVQPRLLRAVENAIRV